jgi:spore coat polysaccharide biosynthesis protein SpsF (cytidylyltransferase family)
MKNKNYALIIQARSSSKRFPNKILKKINKKEILTIMLKRLKKKFRDKIIVAIGNKNCKKIVDICKKQKIKFFIGSDNNVLERHYKCAQKNKIKTIVRIPSDCPLVDPYIIKKGLKKFFSNNIDYVSNIIPPSYIDGNDVEIFSIGCLAKIFNNVESIFDKEHVTSYLKRNKKIFKIMNFKTSEDLSLKYRLTLDYEEDLIVIKKILSNKNIFLNYKSIKNIFKKNPTISKINNKFIGTMWYQKKQINS